MKEYIEKYNLHTHSFYCGHGHGTIAEYVAEARRLGLELIGFSEHCPRPDGRFKKTRMAMDQMPLYEADCRREGDKGDISVLVGYECDYSPKHLSYYRDLLDSGRVDYLITGTHFIPSSDGRIVSPFSSSLTKADVSTYLNHVLRAMDSGLFSFTAHPDLYLFGYHEFDDFAKKTALTICRHAVETDTPLEVNGNGMLRPPVDGHYAYPVRAFWQIAAAEGVKCVYNTDAHEVENLGKTRGKLEEFISPLHLKMVYPSLSAGKLEFV